jgi:hypothetical protein
MLQEGGRLTERCLASKVNCGISEFHLQSKRFISILKSTKDQDPCPKLVLQKMAEFNESLERPYTSGMPGTDTNTDEYIIRANSPRQ